MRSAVNAVKLMGSKGGIVRFKPPTPHLKLPHNLTYFDIFSQRVSSELTKNHQISPLKYVISPLKSGILTKSHRTCFAESTVNLIYIQFKFKNTRS